MDLSNYVRAPKVYPTCISEQVFDSDFEAVFNSDNVYKLNV